jgi:membrane protease YdiL (CAAX protease family)
MDCRNWRRSPTLLANYRLDVDEELTPLWWVGAAVLLWALSNGLTQLVVWLVGAEETAFDRLIESSPDARIALAVLAVLTAPLVEEIVYRGIVYPAFTERSA